MKRIINVVVLVCCVLFSQSYAMTRSRKAPASSGYFAFYQLLGLPKSSVDDKVAAMLGTLCDPLVIKTSNTKVVATSIDALLEDVRNSKTTFGDFTLEEEQAPRVLDDHGCLISMKYTIIFYSSVTRIQKKVLVTVVLTLNDHDKIIRICEQISEIRDVRSDEPSTRR